MSESSRSTGSQALEILGKGGCCNYVKRSATGGLACKAFDKAHLTAYGHLFNNEAQALRRLTVVDVPRVVKLSAVLRLKAEGIGWIVMELVEGEILGKWCEDIAPTLGLLESEMRSKRVIAQLCDSVRDMHIMAGVAHLDITVSNIMMKKESSDNFDQIRLIDFGLSEVYPIDRQGNHAREYKLDVVPAGCSACFAPSEQIRALQLGLEGGLAPLSPSRTINGFAADYWALGVVAFFMLTGEEPFQLEANASLPEPPDYVDVDDGYHWQVYELALTVHRHWGAAMEAGRVSGSYSHPMLDKIRQHSTNPEVACDFFIQVLCMDPRERYNPDLLSHPYLAQQQAEMQGMLAARLLKSKTSI